VPKPLVDFANKPILCHQIEALTAAGVTHIYVSINYQQIVMAEEIKQYEQEYGVKIECLIEKEPMGTAGPIGLAKEQLLKDNEEGLFFVINSDIVCQYDFK
jgi:mannose-1-phosphate guanylyltransferase